DCFLLPTIPACSTVHFSLPPPPSSLLLPPFRHPPLHRLLYTAFYLNSMLDEAGFEFIKKCIEAIEEKGGLREQGLYRNCGVTSKVQKLMQTGGLREQGLYRNCGVTSKVQKLMQTGLDKRRSSNEKLNFADDIEWEIKTISSAIKTFLRNLPEPLMTFDLHSQFINAAKMDSAMRVSHIHYYVHQLPKTHIDMLRIIIEHLKKVADRSSENLMTVGNLGVCFGPTLLRPKEETMAAIMDIKFCNVVVEVLIANCDLIFNTRPSNIDGIPCPPKPLHRSGDSSESSAPFLDVGPSYAKRSSVSPPSLDKRAYAEGSSTSGNNRPRSIVNSTSRQRPPHIYDTVASSFPDSQDDANVSSPTRLVPSYGKPSTSAGATPVSPTGGTALSSPALNQITTPRTHHMKRATSAQVNANAQFGNISGRQRRVPDSEVRCESSDSLNSAASGSDVSPSPTGRHQHGAETTRDRGSSTVKAKMSSSYAPAYNPFACESVYNSAVHAGTSPFTNVTVSECRGGGAGAGRPGAATAASYQGVNSNAPLQNVTLNELRVSPLFSYVHPIGSLQPSRRVKTLYACTAGHDTELSFQPGQIITNVYESKEEGWLVGTLNGKTGLIPANYVEPLP
ncbi:Rho GTPase-activating protein 26, partial [Toxocara canis]